MPYLHIAGVSVTAQFSAGRRFRYRLEISRPDFSPAHGTACVVMQNPSYADGKIADKSVQFMEKNVFLRGLPEFAGVRRLIVVNQFARVQTNGFKGGTEAVGPGNNAAIRRALREAGCIILAWGKANPFLDRQQFVLDELRKLPGKKLFQTRMHPSRGRYEDFIRPFSL